MRGFWLACALAGASAAALAAQTSPLDTLAGVYKHRFQNHMADGVPYQSEDILEVVKVTTDRAYVRAHLEFANGHSCAIQGVARVAGDRLAYSTGTAHGQCVLSLSVENGNLVLHDAGNVCMLTFCGMRGILEGARFALTERRGIRYLPRLLASREYREAMAEDGRAAAGAGPPSTSRPAVAVAPMHSKGEIVQYPRLVAFPNGAVQKRVNAIFAAREAHDHKDRLACIADAKASPGHPGYEFSVAMDATYVSPRYLSLRIYRSSDCGGMYPNDDIPDPLTIDLATGAEVTWRRLFERGFFPAADSANPDEIPFLTGLYQKHYVKEGGRADPQCRDLVANLGGGTTMSVWLDAKRGLLAQPDFPHVVQACADAIAIPVGEIADYIEDATFLADLRATVHR